MSDVAALRPRMFGIAYRILGSISDAEDVVQDAFIRWAERGETARDATAWITTVTARLAIDRARRTSHRRETYVGEWLPEPLVDLDPAEDVRQADDLAIGFLRVLERLLPDERTALLLHDAFDYSHAEIAVMLEKSEEAVRQMTSRARHRVREERPRFAVDRRAAQATVGRFLSALQAADVDGLRAVLATDVIEVADGGGRVNAGTNPVVGIERVLRLLIGLRTKHWSAFSYEAAHVNGIPGFLVGDAGGTVYAAVGFDFADGRIGAIYTVVNPEKLVSINALRRSRARC
jgi:RNA polymerase sigma-70 factor (ECF subfamily)